MIHSSGQFSVFRSPRFWVSLALSAVIYLPSLFWALGLDQNIFAEIGSLLLNGKRPYLDAWDVKPPNIFYTYALFEWLIGRTDFAVRLSDYLSTLAACAVMFVWVDRQVRTHSENIVHCLPFVASLLLILTLLSLGLSDTAQTESYSLVFLLIAACSIPQSPPPSDPPPHPASPPAGREEKFLILPLSPSRGRGRVRGRRLGGGAFPFIAGAAIGIATFYKSTNAIFLLPIAIELMLVRRTDARRLRMFGLLIAGFLIVSGLELGVLALWGNLSEYVTIALNVARAHPEEISNLHFFDLFSALWNMVDIWSIVALIGICWAVVKRDAPVLTALRMSLLYLAAGLAAVYFQNKGWGYHYVIVLPGLIGTCAIASFYLFLQLRDRSRPLAISLALIVIVLTLTLSPSARRRLHYTQDAISSIQSHPKYLASLGAHQSLYYPPCTEALANYIRSRTSPTDRVFIFGEEPGAYWKSGRQAASRYIYTLLFTSGVLSSKDLRAMDDTIATEKPLLFIVERFDTTRFRNKPETSETLLRDDSDFRPLNALLQHEYRLCDTVCGKFLIYKPGLR